MLADGKWGKFSAMGNIPSAETRPTPRPATTRPAASIKQKSACALKKERGPERGRRKLGGWGGIKTEMEIERQVITYPLEEWW